MTTNAQNIIIGEYIIALGVSSWGAIKAQQAPWPPTVVRTGLAFAILGTVGLASPELAATLGAGFLLAQLLKVLNKEPPYTGGVPEYSGRDGKHVFGTMKGVPAPQKERSILSWKSGA